MDKEKPSAKEHLLLGVMILLAFFILTTQYNPQALPALNRGHIPTGAAVAQEVSLGSMALLTILMIVIVLGVIAGIILWLRRNRQRTAQHQLQEVDAIIADAQQKSTMGLDPLAKKLTKVEQELKNVPIRSATKGHIINSIPGFRPAPRPKSALRHLLKRQKKKAVVLRKVSKKVHHKRASLQDKMLEIQKEINRIKMK